MTDPTGPASRLRSWRHATHAAICDIARPWSGGTVMRASRYPRYWDFNLVRVERDCGLAVEQLIAVAERELRGLRHRRLDFDLARWAAPLREGFERHGWLAEQLVWMRHDGAARDVGPWRVSAVPYERTEELRGAWHREDFPGQQDVMYRDEAREVALRRAARLLATYEGGEPVGFAQLEAHGASAEITQVYVHRSLRGQGRGGSIVRAAIAAAGQVKDLWICAEDGSRSERLYRRLGFAPVERVMQFTRLP